LPASKPVQRSDEWLRPAARALATVFRNPQSILCGMIAGLLFLPTTIFDMIWGVRYLQEARGFDYASAVLRSSMVPIGWIIGCPLLGFVSDRIGRRKPVIIAGGVVLLAALAWILFARSALFPPYVVGLVAGMASGAAMLPYTVIKEANPPEASGTATGVVNFLNFTFSALLIPVFGWIMLRVSGGLPQMQLEHYQTTFTPLLFGVGLAILLTFFLKETGPAIRLPEKSLPEEAMDRTPGTESEALSLDQASSRCRPLWSIPARNGAGGAVEAAKRGIRPTLVGPGENPRLRAKHPLGNLRLWTRLTVMPRRRKRLNFGRGAELP
jgi:MFS family permease